MPNENYFEDWASQFSNENEPLKNKISTSFNHQTEEEISNHTLPKTPTDTRNEQITSTPHTNNNIMESTTHTTASIIKVIGVGGGGGNAAASAMQAQQQYLGMGGGIYGGGAPPPQMPALAGGPPSKVYIFSLFQFYILIVYLPAFFDLLYFPLLTCLSLSLPFPPSRCCA